MYIYIYIFFFGLKTITAKKTLANCMAANWNFTSQRSCERFLCCYSTFLHWKQFENRILFRYWNVLKSFFFSFQLQFQFQQSKVMFTLEKQLKIVTPEKIIIEKKSNRITFLLFNQHFQTLENCYYYYYYFVVVHCFCLLPSIHDL